MNGHKVLIDGVETTLKFQRHSPDRGFQYLTPGNESSIGFPFLLSKGMKFRSGGRRFEVLS